MKGVYKHKMISNFWNWFKSPEKFFWNLILPIGLTILVAFLKWIIEGEIPSAYSISFDYVLVFSLVVYPQYLVDEMSKLSDKIDNRLDELPQLVAFHTEHDIMKDQMEKLHDFDESSLKWIYSKFISKLLTTSFSNFETKFNNTAEYSKFSTDVMRECVKSIQLTGSMSPYEWLSSLAINDTEKPFYNNLLERIDINKDNHSVFLKDSSVKIKYRVVCLSEFDYEHLFLFERSIREYYRINEGVPTKFIKWTERNQEKNLGMEASEYEYALYDENLLLKYNKKEKQLTVLLNKEGTSDEFKSVESFFKRNTPDSNIKESRKLLTKVRERKIELMKSIINYDFQIPHKYAYLFHDTWDEFAERSDRFGFQARNAAANLISQFQTNNQEPLDIIELGAGKGDKIDLVCDRIGTDRINTYTLVDICPSLLEKSFHRLKKRFDESERNQVVNKLKLDLCASTGISDKDIRDKTVLILNNSTIFTEKDFPWDSLKKANRIIITLDMFDPESPNTSFSHYQQAFDLLLSPLKIFGIPIKDGMNHNNYKDYFSDNSLSPNYNNSTPLYKIYFHLKDYLASEDIKKIYERVKDTKQIDKNVSKLDIEYKKKRNEFDDNNRIVILSSLKFKKCDSWKEDIKSYFIGKLEDSVNKWDIVVEESSMFCGINIKKK